MKRMNLHTPGRLEDRPLQLEDASAVTPGPGEIAIAIRACAVCRTDLQLAAGDLPMRRRPIVPGHQLVGVVDAVGPGTTGWSIGERACAGWLASTCGKCGHCTAERENLCESARFTGWDVDGGYATRAIVNGAFAFHLPAGFGDVEAAPLLCGGVIGYRSLKRSRVRPGQRLGLYGFGASALLTIQVARHWGCRVFVVTRSVDEQERARAMGAEWAGDYSQRPPVELDAAITFAPSGDVVVAALTALARGGTVAINAIHLDRVPQFSYDLLWWERNLVSVANYTRQDAIEFLELAVKVPLRTHFETHPLHAANEALARVRDGTVDVSAVLLP
jgi:propanol-preferring alcohol dehydrogenase